MRPAFGINHNRVFSSMSPPLWGGIEDSYSKWKYGASCLHFVINCFGCLCDDKFIILFALIERIRYWIQQQLYLGAISCNSTIRHQIFFVPSDHISANLRGATVPTALSPKSVATVTRAIAWREVSKIGKAWASIPIWNMRKVLHVHPGLPKALVFEHRM